MKNPASIIFLLPALVSLYYVLRGHTEKAFLRVFLPTLVGLPFYYGCQLPHLPPISASEAVLIPITAATLLGSGAKWRFSRVDLWVFLFIGSLVTSELLHESILTNAIFTITSGIMSMLFPYIVGRLLIEPSLRLSTVKRFISIILFLALIGLYELKMGVNPYTIVGSHFLDSLPWTLQFRGGWARVAVSFSDAELAGIAFVIAIALNYWLIYVNKSDGNHRLGPRFSKLEKYHAPSLILFALLFATQSRGPILGAVLALAILQIPRFKNIRKASIITALSLAIGGIAVYAYFDRYTSGTDGAASEQQASASYRRLLLENYKPFVEEGGWFGWSERSRPLVHGQESIDNQFLLTQLNQGRVGLILFVLIGLDTVWHLIAFTWRFKQREDIYFAFSLLAAMVSLWAVIGTVYLGEQLPQIAFLLIGWSQSLQEGNAAHPEYAASKTTTKFRFRRVLV